MSETIKLSHGSGGSMTQEIINKIFITHFSNSILMQRDDSAVFKLEEGKYAFTTDSFVISPIFFRGGDIGKLSVCGTVNDLSASGAKPMFLSCGFIIEEGFLINDLEKIVQSISLTAKEAEIQVVAGDTKVVRKGECDGAYINTSGIGIIPESVNVSGSNAKPGDDVIISGNIGDHGCAILLEREKMNMDADIQSDCAPLNKMIEEVLNCTKNVHVFRDPTRGGVATTLNEIANQSYVGINIFENRLKIKEQVLGICGILGLDPLYMANEGKMIIIAPKNESEKIIKILKKNKYGVNSYVAGEVVKENPGRVLLNTNTGGNRIIDVLSGDQLPRIC